MIFFFKKLLVSVLLKYYHLVININQLEPFLFFFIVLVGVLHDYQTFTIIIEK